MKYLLSGIEHQVDKGFGINAEAFKKSADLLYNSEEIINNFLPQKHMPIFFLYRHSVELFLKSMIVTLHSELGLPYPNNKPQILTKDNKWKDLDKCHWIDALYWYWEKLIIDNQKILEEIAPKGSWILQPNLKNNISTMAIYDRDSTFFRYPFTKNKAALDKEKYSMKKVEDLQEVLDKKQIGKGSFTFILKDEEENIASIYTHDDNVMNNELELFKETAEIFSAYHIMTRVTLSEGF